MLKDFLGGLAGKQPEQLGKAVRDVMHRGVVTCGVDTPVLAITQLMAKNRTDVVALVDADAEVVGMVTARDLMRAYMEDTAELKAEDVMQPHAAVVTPDTLVIEAVHIMLDRGISHLLIKGEARREVPVGIVSATDIVRAMAGLPPERPALKRPSSRSD